MVDKVSLVIDATSAAGLCLRKYSLGGLDFIVENNIAKEFEVSKQKENYVANVLTRDYFASSVITMNQLIRSIVNLVGLSIQDAIKMATLNPTRVLGIDANRGFYFPNKREM